MAIRDPDTGGIYNFSVRKGVVSEFRVVISDSTIDMVGTEAGQPVGQRFTREGFGRFALKYSELRRGTWIEVRQARFRTVAEPEIEALGWIKRNPEFEAQAEAARRAAMASNPSFGRRLVNALQDGVVEGARDGVQRRVSKTIGGE